MSNDGTRGRSWHFRYMMIHVFSYVVYIFRYYWSQNEPTIRWLDMSKHRRLTYCRFTMMKPPWPFHGQQDEHIGSGAMFREAPWATRWLPYDLPTYLWKSIRIQWIQLLLTTSPFSKTDYQVLLTMSIVGLVSTDCYWIHILVNSDPGLLWFCPINNVFFSRYL